MLRKILIGLGSMVFFFSSFKQGEAKNKNILIYVLSPITSIQILPYASLISIPGTISDTIFIVASPGEYEPGSFVVYSFSDINSLQVKASNLKGKRGIIPSSCIDIKVVKCWYQSGGGITSGGRIFIPELLLKDDSLVKVDAENKENYLKVNYPDGEKYIRISEEKDNFCQYLKRGASLIPIKAFPVKDSSILLPVNIPEKTNKQFWITVRVPEKAKPGIYTGKINLSNAKEVLGKINLKIKVLPIKLSPPYYTSSIYYRGKLHPDFSKGSISSEYKSKEQLRAELKNMFSHGVTNPICYQGFDEKLLGEYLKIRNRIGMGEAPLYMSTSSSSPATIKRVIEFAKSYNIPEVYFYGQDEARGEQLKSQRDAWIATRKAGGRVFVAGHRGSNFEAMGDIQDLLNCAGYPSKEEAEKWHSVGHKIWCYANPQGGVENPEIYRRNFGLLLWKYKYDGAATYAYQHSFGNIWNDFDHPIYRDHNFTYPTVDGVIDTIQWEGYREGVDDVRYLTTLLQAIERAKKSRNNKKKKIAFSAEIWLRKLKLSDLIEEGNLDDLRSKMRDFIIKLERK